MLKYFIIHYIRVTMDYLLLLFAYLLGSCSFSIIICKLCKLPDPRTIGSTNAGATNVSRFATKKITILVLLGDMLKGTVMILLAKHYASSLLYINLTAIMVVIGHIFPIFFGFKGGKGIATMLGVMLGLSIPVTIGVLAIWGMIFIIFKYSSLAAIISTVMMPILTMYLAKDYLFSNIMLAILLIAMHHSNIKRLYQGTEQQLTR